VFRSRFGRQLAFAWVALCSVTGMSPVHALNPSLEVSQHGHRTWKNIEGIGSGTISAIAQTSDGYMWLATPRGLMRFDGVRSVSLPPPAGASFKGDVRALLGARDGTLWIGTTTGLFERRGDQISALSWTTGARINAIREGGDGAIWVAGTVAGRALLCVFRRPQAQCHGEDGRLGSQLLDLYLDRADAMWLVGADRVWKWGAGGDPMASWKLPSRASGLRTMAEMEDRSIVIGLPGEVAKVADGKMESVQLPAWARHVPVVKALRDKEGSLWLGTADYGLLHLHQGRWDSFGVAEGLSGDNILELSRIAKATSGSPHRAGWTNFDRSPLHLNPRGTRRGDARARCSVRAMAACGWRRRPGSTRRSVPTPPGDCAARC